ncbi:MAG: LytTR family DNA-binding domain-containing protein [Lachnospiraceae bacterium]|nr:LytTR family DNA-binding domain-containing protein [Lachnospiraceae bacterium]
MLKIMICDDEQYYLNRIQDQISYQLNEKQIVDYEIHTFDTGEQLCENENIWKEYQIFFLDINLKDISGIELAKRIRAENPTAYIAFITSYADYALEGYRVEAIRYIMKDMLDSMLMECMDIILEKMRLNSQKVRYTFLEGEKELYTRDISYLESSKHKVIFYMTEKKEQTYTLYEKLDFLEGELEQYGFLRIHKSYLVNMDEIKELSRYQVTLKRGEILSIPREKYRSVAEKYYAYEGKLL